MFTKRNLIRASVSYFLSCRLLLWNGWLLELNLRTRNTFRERLSLTMMWSRWISYWSLEENNARNPQKIHHWQPRDRYGEAHMLSVVDCLPPAVHSVHTQVWSQQDRWLTKLRNKIRRVKQIPEWVPQDELKKIGSETSGCYSNAHTTIFEQKKVSAREREHFWMKINSLYFRFSSATESTWATKQTSFNSIEELYSASLNGHRWAAEQTDCADQQQASSYIIASWARC